MTEPTTEDLLALITAQGKQIDMLLKQVAEIRGIKVMEERTDKPVNMAAYTKAIKALAHGDPKPIREYKRAPATQFQNQQDQPRSQG